MRLETALPAKDFRKSAKQSNQAIYREWRPIWSILIGFFQKSCNGGTGCDDYQRALNLQAAYEGWLAVRCDKKTTNNTDRLPIEEMRVYGRHSNTGVKRYGCWARSTGCISNSDCGGAGTARRCYCYGNGCVALNKGKPISRPSKTDVFRNTIREVASGNN